MPELELHDLTNDQTFAVPAEGLVFGREGGDADVQLADNTISRRQARISYKAGTWLYETMAVAQGKPVPRPRQLAQGETFHIGQTEFEVLNVFDEEEPEPPPPPKAAKKAPPSKKSEPAQAKTMAGQPGVGPEVGAAGGDAIPAKGVAAMFVAVPKGLAYYLLNVPKLLFNPFGTVAAAIEDQPSEPMGTIELIGYALPALLATALLGSFAAGLALLIGPGHHFSFGAFLPVGPAIGALIGAVVVGFIFHPVTEWVLRKVFKGTSDARTRTNYFLQTMTLAVLLAVPNAIGVIVASLPVPFIGLLGPLLITLASLVSLYVTFQWWTRVFEVAKWARTLLLVLGALSVVFAAIGFVTGLVANIRSLGSHSAVTSTGDADADADADVALAGAKGTPEAAAKARKMAEELKKKAAAEARGAEAAAKVPEAKQPDDKKVEPKKPDKAPDPQPEPRAVEPAPAPAPVAAVAVAPASGAYGVWAAKRAAVEKLLEADPTRLEGSKELQDLYGQYLSDCADVEKKAGKDIAKHKDKTRLYEHLRDAELFHRTGATVDELAKKLGLR